MARRGSVDVDGVRISHPWLERRLRLLLLGPVFVADITDRTGGRPMGYILALVVISYGLWRRVPSVRHLVRHFEAADGPSDTLRTSFFGF